MQRENLPGTGKRKAPIDEMEALQQAEEKEAVRESEKKIGPPP